ncbi:YheC/YheD family protein [Paenibacillus sp. SYP-B3998]|uniref:YheC/YheD family protein n=1 Tax=Paenibacillus sp. SYP-B3998 TaxID=2678564 RepID=A0A6G3ZRW4_9BACL|nr:YheC/YheD family protein [Paenibacillus sp. SYP-B3998]NEW04943.1 YheC/YheD family protein [Paenibacillus sp. SYP-B3998]
MKRYGNNKWGKTLVLNQRQDLRRFVPETKKATKKDLLTMLEKHKMVYIKPNQGTGGFGIIKAEIQTNKAPKFKFTVNTQTYRFNNFDAFYHAIQKKFNSRMYVVQKGIHMLKFNNRPFDIRIMVQTNERGHWEHTGTIGRVAHPRRIVTNYHNGGTPLPLDVLLKPHVNVQERQHLNKELSQLGLTIARHLRTAFPRLKEIGVDVGIDRARHPWIFEVNTRPDPFIFRKLPDSKVFRRVLKLTRLHGRFLPKKIR